VRVTVGARRLGCLLPKDAGYCLRVGRERGRPAGWFDLLKEDLINPIIYVLIWFDVEDYFSPESDDADMQAAELASSAGVPVTVKVVGEKARVLERNRRHDVIQALARHDLGYHSDWHSRPPTIAAYLSDLGWEEGASEFERRERSGLEDLRRIFGRDPICFGQPGSSWAPQAYPVLRKWQISVYLDEAPHVGLPTEQPFWFQGMLHVFNLRRNAIKMEFGSEIDFQRTCELFQSAYRRLSEAGGGLISLYYHPQEFIYRSFQDVVNFGGGANPVSRCWKTEEQRTPGEIQMGYRYYQATLCFMQSFEDACFINASQVLDLYSEPALPEELPLQLILELARKVQREVTFQQAGEFCFSAAEAFEVLTRWLISRLDLPVERSRRACRTLQGPVSVPGTQRIEKPVPWRHFQRAVLESAWFLEERSQVPVTIRIDDRRVSPEDFLANLGKAIASFIKAGSPPSTLTWQVGNFAAAQYAAEDSPELWAWPIFPSGFRSPNLMRLARLQTWTIKPARPRQEKVGAGGCPSA
jgi:hypothetical protein